MSEQKRWPKNAESARRETEELAADSSRLVREARKELKRNVLLAELMLADIDRNQERILRLMASAKYGDDR